MIFARAVLLCVAVATDEHVACKWAKHVRRTADGTWVLGVAGAQYPFECDAWNDNVRAMVVCVHAHGSDLSYGDVYWSMYALLLVGVTVFMLHKLLCAILPPRDAPNTAPDYEEAVSVPLEFKKSYV